MKYSPGIFFVILFCFILPFNAYAYLGPGLGAGTIGAIIGVIVSIFLGIFAVVYYPIKRLLKKSGLLRKKNEVEGKASDTDLDQDDTGGES